MIDPLYLRYEEELGMIRNEVSHFAEQYPLAASRLLLEKNVSSDPHVERLIESFALIAARVRTKLDDEFPKFVESLINRLYPHFTRPVPSMTVVGFEIDPKRARVPDGLSIPRSSHLESAAQGSDKVQFRTAMDTTLWPIRTVSAQFLNSPLPPEWGFYQHSQVQAAIRIRLDLYGGLKWHEVKGLKYLRFYLRGSIETAESLLDTIMTKMNSCHWVNPDSNSDDSYTYHSEDPIRLIGLEPDQAILPSFEPDLWPYRLLSEYMVFPEKFHFIDIPVPSTVVLRQLKLDRYVDLIIGLKSGPEILSKTVNAETFTLGCTTAVNLFAQTAEPIKTEPTKYSYRVIPDVAHPYTREIYSIESVTWSSLHDGISTEFHAFYDAVWELDESVSTGYWHSSREFPRDVNRSLSDIYITIVSSGFEPTGSEPATLVVRTLCSNGDLPHHQTQIQGFLNFTITGSSLPVMRAMNISRVTPSLRPPSVRFLYGKLLSHLNLNHLSWTQGPEGIESFRQLLRLYIPSDTAVTQERRLLLDSRIDSLEGIETRPFMHRLSEFGQSAWVRGIEINLLVRSEEYLHEGGLILWGAVLQRFLSMHLPVNSIMKFQLVDTRSKGVIFAFDTRTGEIPPL